MNSGINIGSEQPDEINFHSGSQWIMKISREGIFFNREVFTDATPDDFAWAVISLLEKQFKVKFEKEDSPYDRSAWPK